MSEKISKSERMLKYQKTISKSVEFSTVKEDYPDFHDVDYTNLSFVTVYYISEYADAIITDNFRMIDELSEQIKMCSEYYDAALTSKEQPSHTLDFLLSASLSYFFSGDFGSAKALIRGIIYNKILFDVRLELVELFNVIFFGKRKTSYKFNRLDTFCKLFNGIDVEKNRDFINCYMKTIDYGELSFFSDCFYAVVKIAFENSARKLLPKYSGIDIDKWEYYFSLKNSIKMLWPAQKLLCKQDVLKGKNAVVQLPTGVGKTKSVELIIHSLFLSERGKIALIIAPLRSLCNEIVEEITTAFPNANVNLISDLLENDYYDYFGIQSESILVCTPEKFQFIIHHTKEIFSKIDLLIFDESHMFDDKTRGAKYELLVSYVRSNLAPTQQLVLMSAVLSNANEIVEWLFNDESTLAYDSKIKTTPKKIGFMSSKGLIHFYSNSFDEEDFFISKTVSSQPIKSKKNNKIFPENNSTDYSLYFANKLSINGGVAIYVAQRRMINPILRRAVELKKKECQLSNLIHNADAAELEKFNNYFSKIYGSFNNYAEAASLGILPHYSKMDDGIKAAIEFAIKRKHCAVVVCTSTLAQGVNIPIKYLLMSSIKNSVYDMTIRNFQNLIGRTARSGTYTEGSIIITNPILYDKREEGKGKYDWERIVRLLDSKKTEPCSSAILEMLRSQAMPYTNLCLLPKAFFDFICENLLLPNWKDVFIERLNQGLEKKDKANDLNKDWVKNLADSYYITIGNIETELCYYLSSCNVSLDDENSISDVLNDFLKSLFAYKLATNEEKEQLLKLFTSIYEKIKTQNIDYRKIGKSMSDINQATFIISLIEDKDFNNVQYEENILLELLMDSFNDYNRNEVIDRKICLDWLQGKTFSEIALDHDMKKIEKIEDMCERVISYEFSFFIGNVIDYLNDDSCNITILQNLQSKIKYGVDSSAKVFMMESFCKDRWIINLLSNKISFYSNNKSDLVAAFVKSKDSIISELSLYPAYYLNKFNKYIGG